MREYTLEQWRAMRARGTPQVARLAERARGAVRARPRSEEERAAIARMALVEVRRRAAENRLVLVAPRTYELRPSVRHG
ncbi:MAG: hypothetical protein C0418_01195 [Coriobacteriaceae bacterium]|nr:hypothetical protein [Coriobacteriaceae bacterium]